MDTESLCSTLIVWCSCYGDQVMHACKFSGCAEISRSGWGKRTLSEWNCRGTIHKQEAAGADCLIYHPWRMRPGSPLWREERLRCQLPCQPENHGGENCLVFPSRHTQRGLWVKNPSKRSVITIWDISKQRVERWFRNTEGARELANWITYLLWHLFLR